MKILVVDNNKNDLILISKMLRGHGYEVLEASNGVEALRLLENIIPDMIISNISMSGMDGFTLLLQLKKNSKTNLIPFVFYTETYVSEQDRELGLSLGASKYILRPREPEELFCYIEAVLKEFKAGELKPKRPKITEEEYLDKYSQRISQMFEYEINRIDREIEKRKIAEEALQEEITERQKAEEQVRSGSKYARSLIEASLDPLVTISPEGKITDVNKATEEVTGVLRKQLIGTDFSDYFTEPDKAREGYQEVFIKGFVRDYPLVIRHISGSTTDVLYNATVYRNERGKVEGVFAAARDITERKKAQETALQLAAIVESSDDAIISKTLDGIITSWNQGAEMIYGYSADDVIGKPISILLPSDISDEMPQIFKQIKRGKLIEHFETVRARKDGVRIHVSLTISPIKDASGMIIGASTIARNITESKRNEEKLHEASLYTRSLIEASLDPLVTIGSEGKIMDVNKATEQVTGLTRKKLIGTDFSDYFTEPESAREGYMQVFEKGFVKDYPLTILHRSGSTTDVLYNATVYRNERGEIEGVFAAARDVSERKHAEELAKLEDRRLQSQLKISMIKPETLNDLLNLALEEVISLSDSKVGYIYYYSEEKEEFILHAWSKNVKESCTIQNPQTTYQLKKTGIWGEAVRQRKPIIVNDFHAYNPLKKGYPEGHTPLFRFMTLPLFNNENIVAVVGVGNKETDYNDNDVLQLKQLMDSIWLIAQRQEAQESMWLAKEAAERASRIKSEFLMTMSHELRTPMNAILGFSDLIKMKTYGELNEKQEHYINNISNSGKHLLGIITDILDLVKVESGENLPLSITSFNASENIDETLIFVQEKAVQKNIIIKKEIDPELKIISADKIRFKQILLNLLDNAIKFSKPEGGNVTIAGRKVSDMAQFSICDTGIGIKEEDMGKLFSMFYQADSGRSRKYGGTGIGLAIIKQIVEQHGGRIWVNSKYGEGSTFTFTLPLWMKKEEKM